MRLDQLETPVLVADEKLLEQNLRRMTELLKGGTLRLRPHYKSHKCAALALRQLSLGAVGMTCAKLSEAEDLVDHGVRDVLIANQIVEPGKLMRAAMLAAKCRLTLCVDDEDNARMLSKAACAAGTTIYVLVEYEIGMERCGVTDPEGYLRLARLVSELPGIEYEGIQAYAGHVSHMADEQERRAFTAANEDRLRSLIALLDADGLSPHTVSGGSTGTALIKAERGLYTELQAGSYLFMDSTYRALGLPFANSLFLLSTVVSRRAGLAVLDAGVKSLGVDQEDPVCLDMAGNIIKADRIEANEEHLKLFRPERPLELGEKLLLIPGHCCSTVNLHDRIYLFSGGAVTGRLAVTARGCSR